MVHVCCKWTKCCCFFVYTPSHAHVPAEYEPHERFRHYIAVSTLFLLGMEPFAVYQYTEYCYIYICTSSAVYTHGLPYSCYFAVYIVEIVLRIVAIGPFNFFKKFWTLWANCTHILKLANSLLANTWLCYNSKLVIEEERKEPRPSAPHAPKHANTKWIIRPFAIYEPIMCVHVCGLQVWFSGSGVESDCSMSGIWLSLPLSGCNTAHQTHQVKWVPLSLSSYNVGPSGIALWYLDNIFTNHDHKMASRILIQTNTKLHILNAAMCISSAMQCAGYFDWRDAIETFWTHWWPSLLG